LLGLVLGPVLEENLRRALLISRGNPWVFVQRPISAGLLALAVVLVVVFSLPALRGRERGSVRG
jgi:TctA family transporter